ncbi:TonB-dependent copper receptor [Citrobacter koseri]|uniref:TonB-dependent copper receptor n=1 Tax=Citrobacter koseri TaxID=545 RepID=A0A447UUS1_CITKO|nr:TonB-dependent copper receptor [Citrobacter koseri]
MPGAVWTASRFRRESLGMRFEKSGIGEVFDKLEANIYYNYANHVMDNYSLRAPGMNMSGSMGSAMEHSSAMHSMSMPMAMQLDRRTVGGRMMGNVVVVRL